MSTAIAESLSCLEKAVVKCAEDSSLVHAVVAGAEIVDAMGEAAEAQPAKRARSDRHVGSASNAACNLVIINQQDFQHRKSDLQILLRQVISQSTGRSVATLCIPIENLLRQMTSKAAGLSQCLPMVSGYLVSK